MNTEQLLDRILVPRPNGREGLAQVATFIERTLRQYAPEVERHVFAATPYGFQLLWAAALLLMIGTATATIYRRYRLALVVAAIVPALLFVETELLWSPVSGLVPGTEANIVGTFPGRPGSPTLIFSAHYDTATQFGDHFTWSRWGTGFLPALLVAFALPLNGLWQQRRASRLPDPVTKVGAVLTLIPPAFMAWCFTLGPVLRAPSPGALDNGGSVAVLLHLAEKLSVRAPDAPVTVKLVFFASEEERALGSWHYAQTLRSDPPIAAINLEMMGGSDGFAYVSQEDSPLRRFVPPQTLVDFVHDTLQETLGRKLAAKTIPAFALTDARSFLGNGIPAITLMSAFEGGFPRNLHSAHDSRDRLSAAALKRAVDLLVAIVVRVDEDAALLQ
jgi:hypothetical protein